MAKTSIKNRTSTPFTQPPIGGTVDVRYREGLEFIREGLHIEVVGGGIYKVMSISPTEILTLLLIKPYMIEGSSVNTNMVVPSVDIDWTTKEF